ncbi:LolA family protein [Moheibacter stercoris]|uniref:Outer membrane lipoprotein-sorting protein n=1 Tax=Moheibacter stercoris TaxID=1628251 RepID=A0ABV2LWG3_9FLAO
MNLKIFSLFLILFSAGNLKAQTAKSIIEKNLENSGGIQKWRSLNSIILKGDAVWGLDQSFPMTVYHKRPSQKKVVFLIDGKEILNEGYDGKNGWTYNEISGKNTIKKDYQPDSFESDILDYDKKGFEAVYKGKSTSEGQECNLVELTKNVNKITYCFSTKDASLLWEENKEEKMYYYDYKIFDGLRFATRMVGHPKEGGEYVIKFYQIQINPTIDDKVFRF